MQEFKLLSLDRQRIIDWYLIVRSVLEKLKIYCKLQEESFYRLGTCNDLMDKLNYISNN